PPSCSTGSRRSTCRPCGVSSRCSGSSGTDTCEAQREVCRLNGKYPGVPRAGLAVVLVPLALIPALGAVQGGFSPGAWVWSGALAAWAAALTILFRGDVSAPAAAWIWLAAVMGLLGWTILSAVWSVDGEQSVLEARRTLVYGTVALALVVL